MEKTTAVHSRHPMLGENTLRHYSSFLNEQGYVKHRCLRRAHSRMLCFISVSYFLNLPSSLPNFMRMPFLVLAALGSSHAGDSVGACCPINSGTTSGDLRVPSDQRPVASLSLSREATSCWIDKSHHPALVCLVAFYCMGTARARIAVTIQWLISKCIPLLIFQWLTDCSSSWKGLSSPWSMKKKMFVRSTYPVMRGDFYVCPGGRPYRIGAGIHLSLIYFHFDDSTQSGMLKSLRICNN